MKFTLVCVGKLKETFWKDACAEYIKRLGAYAKIEIIEVPDKPHVSKAGANDKEVLSAEAEEIICHIAQSSFVVLLDRCGKEVSSKEISNLIDEQALYGASNFTFIVGGSLGVSDAVKKQADKIISFGKITLPHNLFRVVLLEQLYRAMKISAGEPYHK